MITVIKNKRTYLVCRKKRQGEAYPYPNTDSDCVPFGNLFSPLLCFLSLKKVCLWYTQNVKKLFKKEKKLKNNKLPVIP